MQIIKNKRLDILINILIILGILIWILYPTPPIKNRFYNIKTTITNIGRLLGIIGLILLSLNIFLSSRVPIIERYFDSLDKAYKKHKKIGITAYIFLLVHPLLLLPTYTNLSIHGIINFFKWQWGTPKTYGSIALFLLTILIILTMYLRKRSYEFWKKTHQLMSIPFIIGGIHAWLIPSDTSNNPYLKVYLFLVVSIALISYFYNLLLYKTQVKTFTYIVDEVKKLNDLITEIKLKPIGFNKLEYTSGQFAFVRFKGQDIKEEEHPFTISTAPQKKYITFSIKSLGDFTSKIHNLKKGDKAILQGPYGKFSYKNIPYKNQVWIAGGIGITPFKSMAESIEREINKYNIKLIYSVKKNNEAIYINKFKNLHKKYPNNFKFILWESSNNNILNAKEILKGVKNKNNVGFLICGPPKMMEHIKNQLRLSGVPLKNIFLEDFGF